MVICMKIEKNYNMYEIGKLFFYFIYVSGNFLILVFYLIIDIWYEGLVFVNLFYSYIQYQYLGFYFYSIYVE